MNDELVFVPLGGVGEIGMNMAAYGFGPANNRQWLIVDCGVTFGQPQHPGIDLIMADTAFLEDHADNVLGLVLTHAHEDHYGAVIDLWPEFDRPVFATPFTASMLKAKLASDGVGVKLDIRIIAQREAFSVGPFEIEAIPVAHSIPESCALHIETSAGRVVHTGDWKMESNPVSGLPTDVKRFAELGAMPTPLALVCDSTNALKEGTSPTELEVANTFDRLIAEAPNRVAVTVFASNLGRTISIARAAQKAGRQVVLSGRSLHRVTNVGRELGLLDGIEPFLDHDEFNHLPRNKVVLICTGSQGESRAAIARIARDAHPAISLDAGDLMIFSSWPIPGNEREVIDIHNQLIDKGIELITNKDELVHVTGHPRRDELRRLYDLLKPQVLVPVHGEAAHLRAHGDLGRAEGIANVMPIRNGDMVRLHPNPEISPNEVPVGELYLDGDIVCTPDESGVRGRRRLSFAGIVVVSLCVGSDGQLRAEPEIFIEGLPVVENDDYSAENVATKAINGVLKSIPKKRRKDVEVVREAVRRAVRSELNQWWGKKPNVSVLLHKV